MILEYLVPVLVATVTAISTYFVTKSKSEGDESKNIIDNNHYLIEKVQELFEASQKEIRELKIEINKLSDENLALRLQVTELRELLIQKGVHCDEK